MVSTAKTFKFQVSVFPAVATVHIVSHRPGKVIQNATYNFKEMHGCLKIKLVFLKMTLEWDQRFT